MTCFLLLGARPNAMRCPLHCDVMQAARSMRQPTAAGGAMYGGRAWHASTGGATVRGWHWSGGGAAPVVALHGFTGGGRDFEPLVRTRRASWWAPDLPGHGAAYAVRPGAMYGMPAHLRVVDAAVAAAGAPVVLLGYSLGGRLALQWALRRPRHVAALVLVGATPGLVAPPARRARARADQLRARGVLRNGVAAFLARWRSQSLIATQQRIAQPYRRRMGLRRRGLTAWGLAGSLRGFSTGVMPPLWTQLHALALPVLLVTGAEDEKFTVLARAMVEALPCATHHVLAGAGHACHLEAPARFLAAWAAWRDDAGLADRRP